jgi:peptide/nickel transport system substrate-binding protein
MSCSEREANGSGAGVPRNRVRPWRTHMRRAKRWTIVLLVLALPAVSAVERAGTGWAQAKHGGTLVMVHTDPGVMNPILESAWPHFPRMSFNGLIDYDPQGNIIPGLATSWQISPDNLTYTFQLRPDVKWHDGKPLTAEDVKFTVQKILDPKVSSRLSLYFQAVKEVQVPGPHTVVFKLKEPDPVFLANLWSGILPKHIWEKEDFAKSQYNVIPVGSGPWKVKEWVRGDHMTFEANPDYFQGKPYLDRIIVKVIPDATVAFAALEKGDVDYLPFKGVVGGPPYQLVDRLKQNPNLEVKVYEVSSMQRLFFRNDKVPFNNPKVRQAIAHAIDRRFIIQKLLFGYGQISNSEVPPAMKEAYNPKVPQYEYDVAKANQLLDEAGLRRGTDGVRFKTHIYGTPGVRAILSEILKEQLKAVGISTDIIINEWTTYYNAIRQTRTVDGMFTIFSLPTIPDPTTEAPRYHSKEIKAGGFNYLFYSNPRVDAIIDDAQRTLDREKRVRLFHEYQDILARDVPMIPLYVLSGVDVWNKKFVGFQVSEWGGASLTFLDKVWKRGE